MVIRTEPARSSVVRERRVCSILVHMKNKKTPRGSTQRKMHLKEELIGHAEKVIRCHAASRELTVDLADAICRRVEYLHVRMQGSFDGPLVV